MKKAYRQIYEEAHGKLTRGMHVHHKIPRYAGGTDDLDNLEALTRDQHIQAHLDRYAESGDVRDLRSAETLKGIFCSTPEERSRWGALGGSAAQKTLKEKRISAFYDPCLRQKLSSMGGMASSAFRDSEAQKSRGRRGGPKNKGFRWYNDGLNDFKYTPKMILEVSFEDFLKANPNFTQGRKYESRKHKKG